MSHLIDKALQAAITAGIKILEIYEDPDSDFSIERKADNSPLTIADRKSHDVIMSFLEELDYPILSEEGRDISHDERKAWRRFWLIDPLDGTKEFIKKNGEFTVNIAFVEDGKPTLGIVYTPVTKVLYVGDAELGAWKIITDDIFMTTDQMITSGQALPLPHTRSKYTVVGSRSHMSEETESYLEALKTKHGEIDFLSIGSSLKLCMVAEGCADEYPRLGPTMEWDTAAAHAVVNASGKRVLQNNLDNELVYNKENLLNPYFIVK